MIVFGISNNKIKIKNFARFVLFRALKMTGRYIVPTEGLNRLKRTYCGQKYESRNFA